MDCINGELIAVTHEEREVGGREGGRKEGKYEKGGRESRRREGGREEGGREGRMREGGNKGRRGEGEGVNAIANYCRGSSWGGQPVACPGAFLLTVSNRLIVCVFNIIHHPVVCTEKAL